MADIKPIGIDQTTGQERTVESADSVVDSIGNQIEIAVIETGDYSGNLAPNVQAVFPWGTPEKLDDPSTLPTGGGFDVKWSPNGEFLVAGHQVSPFITFYQRTGKQLTRLTNPTTLPDGTSNGNGVAWSPNSEFLAFANSSSGGATTPLIFIYQRSGSTFTKLADPATVPAAGAGIGVGWSPNGEFLAVGLEVTPFIYTYRRSGTTFTKLADPATLPPGQANSALWSPDGQFLAVAGLVTPFITIYQKSGAGDATTLTKLADPATLPTGGVRRACSWSPDGQFLAAPHDTAPFLTIYQRSGTTFTKLADPATAPTSTGQGAAWHPNGKFLAVSNSGVSPFITFYQREGTIFSKLSDPATLPAGAGFVPDWSPDGQFLTVVHSTSPFITTYQTDETMPDSGVLIIRGRTRAGE
jgi:Tol biopolymer transport system component